MTSTCTQSVPQRSLLRRSMRFAGASLLLGGTLFSSGCLDRPVGDSKPVTTNVVIQRQINNAINAIDLLLMIDNSSSMADKQKTLADAVPQLLGQLVQPGCVDAEGNLTDQRVALGGSCPPGSSPEFNPVNNIHIGVVTSSLGDHGGNNLCTPGNDTSFRNPDTNEIIKQPPDVNDYAHLAGSFARYASTSVPTANATVNAQGFLAWGNSQKPAMSEADLTAATGIFKDMVTATKELGCGLEAQLEGWFRFLVDPVPPILPITRPEGKDAKRLGSDDALLQQRAAFLRPDSLVAILMLTDENDCSLRDTDVGWVATNTKSTIVTGSAKCAEDPNDPCCYSCTNASPPGGCADGCPRDANGNAAPAQDDSAYQANIRCWQQKRRFGYEFMYPVSRYVVGLTKRELCPDQSFGDMDCDCAFATSIGASCQAGNRRLPNPLYGNVVGQLNNGEPIKNVESGGIPRTDNSLIFLAGIVGVPWQDIGYKDASGNLVYIPVTDTAWTAQPSDATPGPVTPVPAEGGIWANIYADNNDGLASPLDPHMRESIEPRDDITAYDNIEHEWNTAYTDLQYACIYPLTEPRPCDCDPASENYNSCKYLNPNDCCDLSFTANGRAEATGGDYNKPLCNGRTQVNAKAYPGLREIAVLRNYATQAVAPGNSIVASICPADVKATTSKTSPGYGYNPAVAALVTRLKEKLKGSCLPRQLAVDPLTKQVPCKVIEAIGTSEAVTNSGGCDAYCASVERDPVAVGSPMHAAVIDSMSRTGLCGGSSAAPCSEMCLCELRQEDNLDAPNLDTCQSADEGTVTLLPPGYCYIDPDNGIGSPALVENCQSTQRRILRFVGNNPSGGGHPVPLPGAPVFTACQGSALSQQ